MDPIDTRSPWPLCGTQGDACGFRSCCWGALAVGLSHPNSVYPRALPAAVCTILAAWHHCHGDSNTLEKPNKKKKKQHKNHT